MIHDEKECIICYDNKCTLIEEMFLKKLNIHVLDYPIIPFSHAYGCSCKTTFAHNKCLKTVKKCPLCNKVVDKPNLHVELYFEKYLIYIKDDILIKLNMIVIGFIFMYIIFIAFASKQYISKNYYFILIIFHITHICIIFILYSCEFIKRYWLYDDNLKSFY